jgi:hypothetical protein
MIYEKLLQNGFKQYGNWYCSDYISVNLFTKEIKSANNKKTIFSIDCKQLTYEKIIEVNHLLAQIQYHCLE